MRFARGVGWTLAVAGAVLALDRLVVGRRERTGWIEVASLEEVPAGAGRVLTPPYLPEPLRWPPARVVYRTGEHPGWWLGVAWSGEREAALWIGTGEDPAPQALGEAGRALESSPRGPEGWTCLSTELPDGGTLHVLTTLGPLEAERTLDALRRLNGRR